MKILHLSYSDTEGGAAIGAYRLHHAMLHRGIDSQMLVVHKGSEDPSVQSYIGPENSAVFNALSKAGNEIRAMYGVDELPIRSNNFFGLEVAAKINEIAPDIVQLHWIANNTLKLSEFPKIQAPIVWKMADMWAFSGGEHYNRYGEPDRHIEGYDNSAPFRGESVDIDRLVWEQKRKHFADLRLNIVSPSQFLAIGAHESVLFNRYDCHVIPNPLPHAFLSGMPANSAERSRLRTTLGLPQHKMVVCFSAFLTGEVRKGFHHVREMVKTHLNAHLSPADVSFLVIGGNVRQKTNLHGYDVHSFPNTDDAGQYKQYLRSTDLMLFPSEMDSTAMVVQESLAQGVPSVVFDVGGLPEMVEHKRNGYVARPYDAADLAEGLHWWHKLAEADRSAARLYAAKRSKAMHDPGLCVRRYLKLYKDVIELGSDPEAFQTGSLHLAEPPAVDRPAILHRAYIIDASAASLDDSSHNAEHAIAFAAVMHASFVPTTLVINKNADVENPVGETIKAFEWSMYDKIRSDVQLGPDFADASDSSTQESMAIYRQLVELSRSNSLTSHDLVVFPTVDRFCIEATLMYIYGHGDMDCPSFHLNMMFEHANFLRGGYPLESLMGALRRLDVVGSRVFLYAETSNMSMHLTERFGLKVERFPPPSVFPRGVVGDMQDSLNLHDRALETYHKVAGMFPDKGPPPSAKTPIISILGRGREDKGWRVLPDIIETFNTQFGAKTAQFQLQRPREMDGLQAEEQRLAAIPNVRLLPERVTAEELEASVANAQIVMLPYQAGVYANRGSAFAWKAVVHGKPLLVSGDTALVDALYASDVDHDVEDARPSGAAMSYENGRTANSPAQFAQCIADMLLEIRKYQQGARRMRNQYFKDSVLDSTLKRNMRRENFNEGVRDLVISESTDVPWSPSSIGKEKAGLVARLTVAEGGTRAIEAIRTDDWKFSAPLTDGVLTLSALPEPIRAGLENGLVRWVWVSKHVALNQGALRGWPEAILSRTRFF